MYSEEDNEVGPKFQITIFVVLQRNYGANGFYNSLCPFYVVCFVYVHNYDYEEILMGDKKKQQLGKCKTWI